MNEFVVVCRMAGLSLHVQEDRCVPSTDLYAESLTGQRVTCTDHRIEL